MKVVIYTTTHPGCNNIANINSLLKYFPDYEYTFLVLKKETVPLNLFAIIKRLYALVRFFHDGRFEFQNDVKKIEKRILAKFGKLNFSSHPVIFIDKVNGNEAEQKLKEINPHILLQAGAGILKKNIFSVPRIGTINVHHGIAPEIRGIYSTYWCLYFGLQNKLGVTCHFIDEGIDTGTVINQIYYLYNKKDSFIDIQVALAEHGSKTLLNAMHILQNPYKVTSQPVESFYFSSPSSFEYARLKRNGFQAIGDNTKLVGKQIKMNWVLSV